jgi:hypothetical protein
LTTSISILRDLAGGKSNMKMRGLKKGVTWGKCNALCKIPKKNDPKTQICILHFMLFLCVKKGLGKVFFFSLSWA